MDKKTFNVITTHIQDGRPTGQIPHYFITDDEDDDFEIDMVQLFKDSVLCWSTNQGMIENVECKNLQKRSLSGYLWLHPHYIRDNIDLLYQTYLDNNKDIVTSKKEFFTEIVENAGYSGPKTSAKYKSMKVEFKKVLAEYLIKNP